MRRGCPGCGSINVEKHDEHCPIYPEATGENLKNWQKGFMDSVEGRDRLISNPFYLLGQKMGESFEI